MKVLHPVASSKSLCFSLDVRGTVVIWLSDSVCIFHVQLASICCQIKILPIPFVHSSTKQTKLSSEFLEVLGTNAIRRWNTRRDSLSLDQCALKVLRSALGKKPLICFTPGISWGPRRCRGGAITCIKNLYSGLWLVICFLVEPSEIVSSSLLFSHYVPPAVYILLLLNITGLFQ